RTTALPVDGHVRVPGGKDYRLAFIAVIVILEIDGILIYVPHEFHGNPAHLRLCITHRRSAVAVHGTEVPLAFDERIAVAEILRHADHGVVAGPVTMRMVFTHDIAYVTRGCLIRFPSSHAVVMHTVKYSPVHRLHAVPDIGECPRDDDTHCIIQE